MAGSSLYLLVSISGPSGTFFSIFIFRCPITRPFSSITVARSSTATEKISLYLYMHPNWPSRDIFFDIYFSASDELAPSAVLLHANRLTLIHLDSQSGTDAILGLRESFFHLPFNLPS